MTIKQIEKLGDTKVKVYFKEHDVRNPMIGIFVNLRDSDELKTKDMVRFVNQSRLDFWNPEEPNIGLTKIYKVTDFTQIKELVNG